MNKNKILTEKIELQKKFHKILDEIMLIDPHLFNTQKALSYKCITTWSKERWDNYAKLTGNNIPKNTIDDTTGDMLKFLIWHAEFFLDKVLNGYDEKY
jgi:hypothetical protein